MKIVTVVGARPQFIKAATVSRIIRDEYAALIQEVIIHTGQHFDDNMSSVFFEDLDIPNPSYNLAISGGHHGAMTGRMLENIESILVKEKPDWVLVYGDTNSTLAGALAASKLHIPIAHVEAGLRSLNMRMPEEVNRMLVDRISSLLFCPTNTAVEHLRTENITRGVHNVGDVMHDAARFYGEKASKQSSILASTGLIPGQFALATCHRAENTDDPNRLKSILLALGEITALLPVVLPIHPRTRQQINSYGMDELLAPLMLINPLPFLDMIVLEKASRVILTDSGGVQKEAFFYRVPCITMRDETEWFETVDLGWNQIVGSSLEAIVSAVDTAIAAPPGNMDIQPFGMGDAANRIVELLNLRCLDDY